MQQTSTQHSVIFTCCIRIYLTTYTVWCVVIVLPSCRFLCPLFNDPRRLQWWIGSLIWRGVIVNSCCQLKRRVLLSDFSGDQWYFRWRREDVKCEIANLLLCDTKTLFNAILRIHCALQTRERKPPHHNSEHEKWWWSVTLSLNLNDTHILTSNGCGFFRLSTKELSRSFNNLSPLLPFN